MFGGMYWMGIPGVLVGPVIVAFFLALYTIYLHDFLGFVDDDEESSPEESFTHRVWVWLNDKLKSRNQNIP